MMGEAEKYEVRLLMTSEQMTALAVTLSFRVEILQQHFEEAAALIDKGQLEADALEDWSERLDHARRMVADFDEARLIAKLGDHKVEAVEVPIEPTRCDAVAPAEGFDTAGGMTITEHGAKHFGQCMLFAGHDPDDVPHSYEWVGPLFGAAELREERENGGQS